MKEILRKGEEATAYYKMMIELDKKWDEKKKPMTEAAREVISGTYFQLREVSFE